MVFTTMAALTETELAFKRERIVESGSKRRAAGMDLGGRRRRYTEDQVLNSRRLVNASESATQVASERVAPLCIGGAPGSANE